MLFSSVAEGQPYPLNGRILDMDSTAMAGVYLRVTESNIFAVTDTDGTFSMEVPDTICVLEISFIGYRKDTVKLTAGLNVFLLHSMTPEPGRIGEVVVEDRSAANLSLRRIEIRDIGTLPVPAGNIESFLPAIGAAIRNEMSSRYSVRGGSYDENLIYINEIEIYRPMLMKTGQQEGLSFINPDMISSLRFSSGGFEPQYGDKMSSVLDIRYRRPSANAGSISAGLLGASAGIEGTALQNRLTYITGLRYKSNRYLFSTLETRGQYKPDYLDLQSYITYSTGDKLELSFLGNISVNRYNVVPESRSTSFGTLQQAVNFNVYYEGREVDRFSSSLFAFSARYTPVERMTIRVTASSFSSAESITYDVLSYYNIDVLDNTYGSETATDSMLNLGYGGIHDHARNYLNASVANVILSATYSAGNHNIKAGATVQSEDITDRVREWELTDSAGYSLPLNTDGLRPGRFVSAGNRLSSYRLSGYLQDAWSVSTGPNAMLHITGGIRFNYWDISREMLLSPRMRVTFDPGRERHFTWHLAAGLYNQPPFYREMRDEHAALHTDVKAQRSFHVIAGTDYDFSLWQRPFRLSGELYYKRLRNLIPYYLKDVDIQYLPDYVAKGYTYGFELKMNGEFVPDAESWLSVSVMRSMEDRENDGYGYYRRPTDQLLNFGMYFQDYLPNNPSWKFHINMYFGSRIPYNPPGFSYEDESFTLKAYKRVDSGVSKSVFRDRYGNEKPGIYMLKDLSFSFEIFNLFDFRNQASYQWVETVNNQEGVPNMFAVPDYLTGRLFNIRISARF